MNYKQKLVDFNGTLKYKREMNFMAKLIEPKHSEKILDFGCGLGRMVRELLLKGVDVFGYDVNEYVEQPDEHVFRKSFHFQFDKIYFMHSFAHIENIKMLFTETFETFLKSGGYVIVLTPNKDFIEHLTDVQQYVPDPTVVKHYNLNDIVNVFSENGFIVETQGQIGNNLFGHCERIFVVARKK